MDWFWTIYDLFLITLLLLQELFSFAGEQNNDGQTAQHLEFHEQLITKLCNLFRLLKMLSNFQILSAILLQMLLQRESIFGKIHKGWHIQLAEWRTEHHIWFLILNKYRKHKWCPWPNLWPLIFNTAGFSLFISLLKIPHGKARKAMKIMIIILK